MARPRRSALALTPAEQTRASLAVWCGRIAAIDPPQIRDARVLYTIVDGRVLWAAEELHD